jgi:hypothetical protein
MTYPQMNAPGREDVAEGMMEDANQVNSDLTRLKVRTEFYPFLNEQLKELIQQIEMYIQLLYQVLILTPRCEPTDKKPAQKEEVSVTQELKKRVYWLLYDFMRQKESVLKHLELPKYLVPWLRIPVSTLHPETDRSVTRVFKGQRHHVITMQP